MDSSGYSSVRTAWFPGFELEAGWKKMQTKMYTKLGMSKIL